MGAYYLEDRTAARGRRTYVTPCSVHRNTDTAQNTILLMILNASSANWLYDNMSLKTQFIS